MVGPERLTEKKYAEISEFEYPPFSEPNSNPCFHFFVINFFLYKFQIYFKKLIHGSR